MRVYVQVLRRIAWEHEHVEGGPEPHVLLALLDDDRQAGEFRETTVRRWRAGESPGWAPVVVVDRSGRMYSPVTWAQTHPGEV